MKINSRSLFLLPIFLSTSGVSAFTTPSAFSSYPGVQHEKADCTSTALFGEVKPGSVGSLVKVMLNSSRFVYTYGTIRRVVNNHDSLIRENEPLKKGITGRREEPMVDFYRPELIVTQRGGQDDDPNRYMNYSVTPAAMTEFLSNNRQFLKQSEEGGDVEFQQLDAKSEDLPKLFTEKTMEAASERFDGEIVDYMDEKTNKFGLVYGIVLNRTMKRVVVIFRGTVGGTDFTTDANFAPNKEHFEDLGENVKVHSGFSGYLFKTIEGENRTKYDRIVAALTDIYNDLPEDERDDYKVVVSGHSLGGALANLLAFTLSLREGDGDCPLFRYIRAVTFAGPVVGNRDYDRVFQKLESENKLHMLRISNQGDLVPTNPSPYRYTQNGVNMHVRKNGRKMELKYGNKKSLLSQLNLKALEMHGFPTYDERLFQDEFKRQPNMEIMDKTFDEVYQSVLQQK